jgi:hypothetical protein
MSGKKLVEAALSLGKAAVKGHLQGVMRRNPYSAHEGRRAGEVAAAAAAAAAGHGPLAQAGPLNRLPGPFSGQHAAHIVPRQQFPAVCDCTPSDSAPRSRRKSSRRLYACHGCGPKMTTANVAALRAGLPSQYWSEMAERAKEAEGEGEAEEAEEDAEEGEEGAAAAAGRPARRVPSGEGAAARGRSRSRARSGERGAATGVAAVGRPPPQGPAPRARSGGPRATTPARLKGGMRRVRITRKVRRTRKN